MSNSLQCAVGENESPLLSTVRQSLEITLLDKLMTLITSVSFFVSHIGILRELFLLLLHFFFDERCWIVLRLLKNVENGTDSWSLNHDQVKTTTGQMSTCCHRIVKVFEPHEKGVVAMNDASVVISTGKPDCWHNQQHLDWTCSS